jgi:predicted RNA-binding Zn ribbon-like protein
MGFDHDHQVGPLLAAALVNASGAAALEALLVEHGVRRPALTAESAREVADWSLRLRGVFEADGPQARCDAVNALLTEVSGALYLSTHDGTPPHLHLAPDEDDVVARVRAVTAGGLAFFVASAHGTRCGTCARPRCDRAFVDVSRGGRQRYCSARCGNTDAVARHRRRVDRSTPEG